MTRVAARKSGDSDATPEVLQAQLSRDPGEIGWGRVSTAGPLQATLAAIRARLAKQDPGGADAAPHRRWPNADSNRT